MPFGIVLILLTCDFKDSGGGLRPVLAGGSASHLHIVVYRVKEFDFGRNEKQDSTALFCGRGACV